MPTNKEKLDAYYQLQTQFSRAAKATFRPAELKDLENAFKAYYQIVKREPEEETMEVDTGVLRQMALLAIGPLTRLIIEKRKVEGTDE